MHRTRILKFSTMISRPHWMTPHPGFSTEAPGPNGMNVTSALPSRRFRGERFPASIPQPSPISFPPSIENISEAYRLFLSIGILSSLYQRFSHSAYPASGSQAYFLVLVVLDSQMGLALQLPPLLFPAALAPREVYPVFPSCWWRLAFLRFCCVRRSCEKRDRSSVALLLPELPKSL
jgi:hypothetical protein